MIESLKKTNYHPNGCKVFDCKVFDSVYSGVITPYFLVRVLRFVFCMTNPVRILFLLWEETLLLARSLLLVTAIAQHWHPQGHHPSSMI